MASEETTEENETPRGGRNLPAAIGASIVLAALYLGTLWFHPVAFLTLVSVTVLIALNELHTAFGNTKEHPPTVIAALMTPVAVIGSYYSGEQALVVAIIGGLLLGFLATMYSHSRGHTVARMTGLSLMLLWPVMMAGTTGLLLAHEQGYLYVLLPTLVTVANDVGAYTAGRNIGRTPLAPNLSPNKTIEGFLGGAVAAVLTGLVFSRWMTDVSPLIATTISVGVVIAATTGDLAESLIKRDLGVKDLGSILPGHGGFMDRIDGLLFALPTTYLILLAFGV